MIISVLNQFLVSVEIVARHPLRHYERLQRGLPQYLAREAEALDGAFAVIGSAQ
jgi:hypothetical protein